MSKIKRWTLIALGTIFIGIGFLGIVTPVLPTTPFLLLASVLLANASPRIHSWLKTNSMTGPFLEAYTEGRDLSRKRKISTIVILWVTLLISSWFVHQRLWLVILLGLVGIGVTLHILMLGKNRRGKPRSS